MTRRREVQSRLRQLGEIGEIMRSMKNLALMETRKLARYAQARRRTVQVLERAALDFLRYHPQPPLPQDTPRMLVAIGSERGFCGEFNEQIRQKLIPPPAAAVASRIGDAAETGKPFPPGAELDSAAAPDHGAIIAVGSRLCGRLEDAGVAHRPVTGATIAEDLPDTLGAIVSALIEVQPQSGLQLDALYQSGGAEPMRETLLPPFADQPIPAPAGIPPLLYQTPEDFYRQWLEHYLLAALQAILQQSLLTENEQRVRHLEGALQRLDEKTRDLTRRSQSLRQEEITEEIEIILLSAEGLRGSPGKR